MFRAVRVPYGMGRTTVYLPDELDQRLAAEAQAQGVSKGELIRRGVTKLLDESQRARQAKPFPVFHSGVAEASTNCMKHWSSRLLSVPHDDDRHWLGVEFGDVLARGGSSGAQRAR